MFRRITEASAAALTILIDGIACEAREGDSVAAAMLSSGHSVTRMSALSGAPRAPYCLMGVCFECLVTIDGIGNRQACMTEVRPGMQVETGLAKRNYGA